MIVSVGHVLLRNAQVIDSTDSRLPCVFERKTGLGTEPYKLLPHLQDTQTNQGFTAYNVLGIFILFDILQILCDHPKVYIDYFRRVSLFTLTFLPMDVFLC